MATSNNYITIDDLNQYITILEENIKNSINDIHNKLGNFVEKNGLIDYLKSSNSYTHLFQPATELQDGYMDSSHVKKLELVDQNRKDIDEILVTLSTNESIIPEIIAQDDNHKFVTNELIEKIEENNKRPNIIKCSEDEYNLWIKIGLIDDNTVYMITGEVEQQEAITGIYFGNIPYLGGYLPRYIPVERLILDKTRFNIEAGEETWIEASVYPSNSSFRMLDYEVENTDIISINKYGKITGLKEGYSYVKIKSKDNPGAFVNILVVVSNIIAKSIDVTPGSILLTTGCSNELDFKIIPDNVPTKEVYWRTTDRNIAIVNTSGKVTGINSGTCQVIATTTDGSVISDIINVEVTNSTILATQLDIIKFDNIMYINSEQQISYRLLPYNVSERNIKITSSNNNVLSVNNKLNTITAVSPGNVILTIETIDGSNINYSYIISVRKPIKKVETINLEPIGSKNKGDIFNISYNVFPNDADNKNVTVSVNNSNIEIGSNNSFIALKSGKTKIRITSDENPNIYVEEEIEIKEITSSIPATNLKLDHDYIILNLDNNTTANLKFTIYPSNATCKQVYWRSSNTDIISVDYDGNITALRYGIAIVTCYTVYGNFSASCEVKVTSDKVPVSMLTIIGDDEKRILLGETYKLPVAIYPLDAYNQSILFTSSNNEIVTIDNSGNAQGLSLGVCTITATSDSDPKRFAKCKFTVVGSYKDVLATDIIFNTPVDDITINEKIQIKAVVLPTNTTNPELLWSSSNNNIAVVNGSGCVTGIDYGECIIYAYNKASGIIGEFPINVIDKSNSSKDELKSVSLAEGYTKICSIYDNFTQNYITLPATANDIPLNVSSDFTNIANSNGSNVVCNKNTGFSIIRSEFDNDLVTHLNLFVTNEYEISEMLPASDIFFVMEGKSTIPKFNFTPCITPVNRSNLIYTIKEGEDIISINGDGIITGLKPGFAMVEVKSINDVSTEFSVYVIDKDSVYYNYDYELNENIITLYNGEYHEKYLLYSEQPEEPYLTVYDNNVTKYLKLTTDDTDSIFKIGPNKEKPTSNIKHKLIPRYNFRYDNISNINFKSAYTTVGLTDIASKELTKINKNIKLVEDKNSKSIINENTFADTWNGLTDCYINNNGLVEYFDMKINNILNMDDAKTKDILKNVTLHEFLHVLGFDDFDDKDQTEKNKNSIMSYYRDNYLCNTMQPTEIYTLADMYNFEIDVTDLILGSGYKISDKQVIGGDYDLALMRSFSYEYMSENTMTNEADLIVVGYVDKIEEKNIDIGYNTIINYDIITLLISEIDKGNINNDTIDIKIPAGKMNISLGENYLIYLKHYDNVPASPLNLTNAIQKL